METKELHEKFMDILKEVVDAKLPDYLDVAIRFYLFKIIKDLHLRVLEEIEEKEIEDQL